MCVCTSTAAKHARRLQAHTHAITTRTCARTHQQRPDGVVALDVKPELADDLAGEVGRERCPVQRGDHRVRPARLRQRGLPRGHGCEVAQLCGCMVRGACASSSSTSPAVSVQRRCGSKYARQATPRHRGSVLASCLLARVAWQEGRCAARCTRSSHCQSSTPRHTALTHCQLLPDCACAADDQDFVLGVCDCTRLVCVADTHGWARTRGCGPLTVHSMNSKSKKKKLGSAPATKWADSRLARRWPWRGASAWLAR